jgi:hypothetical protein
MAAKVTERLWEMGDIVDVLEAWEAIDAQDLRISRARRRMPKNGGANQELRT